MNQNDKSLKQSTTLELGTNNPIEYSLKRRVHFKCQTF